MKEFNENIGQCFLDMPTPWSLTATSRWGTVQFTWTDINGTAFTIESFGIVYLIIENNYIITLDVYNRRTNASAESFNANQVFWVSAGGGFQYFA